MHILKLWGMNKLTVQLQQYLFILLGVFVPTSIAATNIIIGLLCIFWIFEGNFKIKFQIIKSSKWMLSIFALIGLYALGMFWGNIHLNAEWQFQRLALLLMFPVLATISIDQKTIKHGTAAFLISTFLSALLAILINNSIIGSLSEYISLIDNHWARAAFIKYNYHNILLALSFALCLYLIKQNKTKYKYLLILFIIVYSFSIFTEKGRAGQLLFNFASVFYIFYYSRKRVVKLILWLLLLFSFQVIIYNTTSVYESRFDGVKKTITSNGGEGSVKDVRYIFVRESLNRIFEKPFLGHGTGSFGTIFKNDVDSGHVFMKETTPHNQYLYVWFELGISGLVLLLMIFYYQIRELSNKNHGIHRVLLPLSFIFLMLVDSYFFIFILTIAYIYLYTIYSRYESE